MEKPKDEYDALRLLVEILEPFDGEHKTRLIRWASERVGVVTPPAPVLPIDALNPGQAEALSSVRSTPTRDLKTFVTEKDPQSEIQFAATVAYYYRHEAPKDMLREVVDKETISEAANRTVGWKNGIKRPAQTLVNAYNAGVVDRVGPGEYRLNTVGENLVGVLLPGGNGLVDSKQPKRRRGKSKKGPLPKKSTSKKAATKRAGKKHTKK